MKMFLVFAVIVSLIPAGIVCALKLKEAIDLMLDSLRDDRAARAFAHITASSPAERVSLVAAAMSRDYGHLYHALCQRQHVLALVDYVAHTGDAMRDPCLIKRQGPFEIVIMARGVCYGEVSPFQRNEGDEQALLAALCQSRNVEWVDAPLDAHALRCPLFLQGPSHASH